jgi:hypothetical protein
MNGPWTVVGGVLGIGYPNDANPMGGVVPEGPDPPGNPEDAGRLDQQELALRLYGYMVCQ